MADSTDTGPAQASSPTPVQSAGQVRRSRFRLLRNLLSLGRFGRRNPKDGTKVHRGRKKVQPAVASLTLALYEDSDESGLGASPAFAAETTQGIRGMFPLFFNPPQLTGQKQGANQAGAASHPQCLIACGSRLWGSSSWLDARSLLGIRVYDFALYVDTRVAHGQQQLGSHPVQSTVGVPRSQPDAADSPSLEHVVSNPSVPISLVLRAARDIPLDVLQREMRGVLERRYQKAGGSLDCPQFQQLVECFGQHRIPPQLIRDRSGQLHVREGATMTFSRMPCGRLVAAAFAEDEDIIAHAQGPTVHTNSAQCASAHAQGLAAASCSSYAAIPAHTDHASTQHAGFTSASHTPAALNSAQEAAGALQQGYGVSSSSSGHKASMGMGGLGALSSFYHAHKLAYNPGSQYQHGGWQGAQHRALHGQAAASQPQQPADQAVCTQPLVPDQQEVSSGLQGAGVPIQGAYSTELQGGLSAPQGHGAVSQTGWVGSGSGQQQQPAASQEGRHWLHWLGPLWQQTAAHAITLGHADHGSVRMPTESDYTHPWLHAQLARHTTSGLSAALGGGDVSSSGVTTAGQLKHQRQEAASSSLAAAAADTSAALPVGAAAATQSPLQAVGSAACVEASSLQLNSSTASAQAFAAVPSISQPSSPAHALAFHTATTGPTTAPATSIGTSVVPLLPAPLHETKLSYALLDLYLGRQPVSNKAKETAAETLSRLSSVGPHAAYQPPPGQTIRKVPLPQAPLQTEVSVVQMQ